MLITGRLFLEVKACVKQCTVNLNVDFAELMILLYENTFQAMESKIVRAVINNETENIKILSDALLKYYDNIILTVLYGIFEKE